MLGSALKSVELSVQKVMLHKLLSIMDNTAHMLPNMVIKQQNVFKSEVSSVLLQ